MASFWNNRLIAVACFSVVAASVLQPADLQAQDSRIVYPGGGHVPELGRYLDNVEIYAPIVYRHLAVFPVRLRGGERLRGDWLTMDEALARRKLVVKEKGSRGQVPVVTVENRSRSDHILIMSGELLSGGKQTRTVRQDVVLAPGQRIDLSVYCVEAHRWQGKSELMAGGSLLPQSIHKELRRGADQSRIWSEVASNNAALDAENRTGSLELALKSPAVRSRLGDVRARITPEVPRDSVGFIFVSGGRAAGADFFGRPDLASALLPKLLDAYSVDFVLKRTTDSRVDRPAQQDTAIAFFERIRRAGSRRTSTPGSGAGISTRSGGLLGDGVSLGGVVVHYGVQIGQRIVPMHRRRLPLENQRR
jgi:hypothetical protein